MISQIWWVFFQHAIEPFYTKNIFIAMEEEYSIIRGKKGLLKIWNYVVHTLSKEDNRLYEYLTRRYDIFNVMWSEIFSINFALFVGYVIRCFILPTFSINKNYFLNPYMIWIRIFFGSISMICLISQRFIKIQVEEMAEAIIKKYDRIRLGKLKTSFPTYFKADDCNKTTTAKSSEGKNWYKIFGIIQGVLTLCNIFLPNIFSCSLAS